MWKLIAIALAVAGLFGTGYAVRAHLAAKDMAAHLALDKKADDDRREAVRVADAKTAAREKAAKDENSDLRSKYDAEKASHDADNRMRDAELRASRLTARVRIAAGSCSDSASGVPSGLPAAGADDGPTAQLAPDVAANLERIADTGDDAIRQLTALQEWVNRNVRAVNGAEGVPGGQQSGVTP